MAQREPEFQRELIVELHIFGFEKLRHNFRASTAWHNVSKNAAQLY